MNTRSTVYSILATLLLALPLVSACSAVPGPEPTTTKDSTMSTDQTCAGTGQYKVITSAVGPFPGFPQSSLGAGYTPEMGLVGTKADADVPTVSVMVWAVEPKPSVDETFRNLALGDELSFRGTR
ncbi:hypothetical protein AS189_05925 [Arthrobacter alpinus]|uniref:Uncharacterized protein n=1 Tax=Arthrobacter alpinus TaxID=656366 RepID=A0A0S2LXD8_9MICC|nr:hypothetical protein [Arthrobacter alpinus]ALO66114.1 hypothetical protein AS189_05925 [Arthrobacter alpinus]